MKSLTTVLALCALIGFANAADDKKAPTTQQSKMATCNKDAGDKKLVGDERKAFMKSCLSAKVDGRTAQQDRMKACNKEAGDKKLAGDERKTFMSACLSRKV
jgi:hypothetical protein